MEGKEFSQITRDASLRSGNARQREVSHIPAFLSTNTTTQNCLTLPTPYTASSSPRTSRSWCTSPPYQDFLNLRAS